MTVIQWKGVTDGRPDGHDRSQSCLVATTKNGHISWGMNGEKGTARSVSILRPLLNVILTQKNCPRCNTMDLHVFATLIIVCEHIAGIVYPINIFFLHLHYLCCANAIKICLCDRRFGHIYGLYERVISSNNTIDKISHTVDQVNNDPIIQQFSLQQNMELDLTYNALI